MGLAHEKDLADCLSMKRRIDAQAPQHTPPATTDDRARVLRFVTHGLTLADARHAQEREKNRMPARSVLVPSLH